MARFCCTWAVLGAQNRCLFARVCACRVCVLCIIHAGSAFIAQGQHSSGFGLAGSLLGGGDQHGLSLLLCNAVAVDKRAFATAAASQCCGVGSCTPTHNLIVVHGKHPHHVRDNVELQCPRSTLQHHQRQQPPDYTTVHGVPCESKFLWLAL